LNGYRHKKYLLKMVMRGKLPDSTLTRKKAGFNVPNARWIKGDLKPFVLDHLSSTQMKRMGWFEPRVVEKLLCDHFEGRRDHSHQIWCLLTLSLWWSQFIDGEKVA
jgi:asparagine synthase (glutamine-hydrolysing)